MPLNCDRVWPVLRRHADVLENLVIVRIGDDVLQLPAVLDIDRRLAGGNLHVLVAEDAERFYGDLAVHGNLQVFLHEQPRLRHAPVEGDLADPSDLHAGHLDGRLRVETRDILEVGGDDVAMTLGQGAELTHPERHVEKDRDTQKDDDTDLKLRCHDVLLLPGTRERAPSCE